MSAYRITVFSPQLVVRHGVPNCSGINRHILYIIRKLRNMAPGPFSLYFFQTHPLPNQAGLLFVLLKPS